MPDSEAIFLDEIIDKALAVCAKLPRDYSPLSGIIEDCKNRLGQGALHLAVMGMFKRGKSSFVNTLLGMDILPTSVVPVTSIPYHDQVRERTFMRRPFFQQETGPGCA